MAAKDNPDPCALGVAFIDAQLLSLCTHAATLAEWIENGAATPDLSAIRKLLAVRHAHPEAHAHSEDGMALKDDEITAIPEWPALASAAERKAFALHVPCANALIALADFFDMHRLSTSRAPEVQFLMRLRDAALNRHIFGLTTGEYMPHASFGERVIDAQLDGQPLFDEGTTPGFITFGDVVDLMVYLRKLLRSMQATISAGDAG